MNNYNLNNNEKEVDDYFPLAEIEFIDIDGNNVKCFRNIGGIQDLNYLSVLLSDDDYHKTINPQNTLDGPIDMKQPVYITIKPALKSFDD